MTRRIDAFVLLGVIVFLVIVILLVTPKSHIDESVLEKGTSGRIGLVEVVGGIWDARQWVRDIDDFARRDNIDAIVVRFESPGGVVGASQELYNSLHRAREHKPVIASFGSVAASGAYYAALGADSIVANPASTTGSIGVIISWWQAEGLLDKLGVDLEVVASGRYKDSGNPSRPLREDERALIQDYIDDAFDQFSEIVALERGLTAEEVAHIADGRVMTGRMALEYGLVDRLGDQTDAIALAASMAGLKGRPSVIRPIRRNRLNWYEMLFEEAVNKLATRLETQPVFQYRWNVENVK